MELKQNFDEMIVDFIGETFHENFDELLAIHLSR